MYDSRNFLKNRGIKIFRPKDREFKDGEENSLLSFL